MTKQFIQKSVYLLFISSLLFSCRNTKMINEKNYMVSGKVTTTNLYCGGAAPTKEMLERLKKPIPYLNKIFYVKNISDNYSEEKIILNFQSDSLGNFRFQLQPGSYAIFLEEQINKPKMSDYKNLELNQSCYQEWQNKPYKTLEIKESNTENLSFRINRKCFIPMDNPCLSYTGPLPQ